MPTPALVIPSPVLIDQTFPRHPEELQRASVALGVLLALVDDGRVVIALTSDFLQMVEEYPPAGYSEMPSLQREIRASFSRLFLRGAGAIRFRAAVAGEEHPVPLGVQIGAAGNGEFWASDAGALLAQHGACCPGDLYCRCAGVACDHAFAGLAKNRYGGEYTRAFPLIGPDEVQVLSPIYEYDVPANSDNLPVTVADVERNFRYLGATHRTEGGDHPAIHFPNGSKWSYARHGHYWVPQIRDSKLRQLIAYTSMPIPAIKFALANGAFLKRRLRACFTEAATPLRD